MKDLKIEIPEGYEVDKEKSTFERIVFKKKEVVLPLGWGDLRLVHGYKVTEHCQLKLFSRNIGLDADHDGNVFSSKEEAKASIALAKLTQLRSAYRQGWKPDWRSPNSKYCILLDRGVPKICINYYFNTFLLFQSREVAEKFLNNFKPLILEASPLLFG